MQDESDGVPLPMVAGITAAYLRKNRVTLGQVNDVIRVVHGTLARLIAPPAPEERRPFVPPKKSVWPDYIINLDDGSHHTVMTRYLKTKYNMTPADYRRRWNLPPDYPMVAPNHRQVRSEMAKEVRRRRTNAAASTFREEAA